MNNRTRAEKIRDLFKDEFPFPEYLMPKIEAILDEAIREASLKISAERCKRCETQGFAAAQEQAAGIANEFECNSRWIPEGIAERIRAMEDQ